MSGAEPDPHDVRLAEELLDLGSRERLAALAHHAALREPTDDPT